MREEFLRAMTFRHACRVFDATKRLARADIDYVLEAGRLSPSSLGLEPWRFLVIEDATLRRHLRPACWNQSQITSCSAVIVILALRADLAADSDYVRKMFRQQVDSDDAVEEAMGIYRDIARGDIVAWSVAQCHIAAANMMTAAAAAGIDSCPMGGFEPEAVADVLGIDRTDREIALLIALGYRAQPQPPRHRLALSDLVEYR